MPTTLALANAVLTRNRPACKLLHRMDGFKATKIEQGYSFQLEAVDLGPLTTATIAYVTKDCNKAGNAAINLAL